MKKENKEKKLKKDKKKSLDFILLFVVILLVFIGLIMVLSASSPSSLSQYGNSYYYFEKQLGFAIVGIIAMIIISKIDYKIYKKFYMLIYIIGLILLILVPIMGRSAKGAKRWIVLFGVNFQPSEIVKIGIIIFYAALLTKYKDKLKTLKYGFIMPILYLLPILFVLFFFQDHLSACIIMGIITLIMMISSGTRMLHICTVGSAGGIAAVIAIVKMALSGDKGSFRIQRLTAFLNPWADPQDSGWQIIQALYAIGSGGLFGVGLGQSKQKYLYISEPHNDFIFAVIAEELGFIGCLFIILLFAIFVYRGIIIAIKAPDMFGSLVAVGITTLIGIQVIINIAVVTSSMPVTGMTLPFISSGGTALLILLASIGILLNISRNVKKV